MVELMYFKSDSCIPCKALLNKITPLIQNEFNSVQLKIIDIQKSPEIAGQRLVFTVPFMIINYDQKEAFRLSAYTSIQEVREKLNKLVGR